MTAEQMEWLLARADELGGNLSAALRQTITDARLLEMARQDFKEFHRAYPDVVIPFNDEGSSWVWEFTLGLAMTNAEDMELRREEAGEHED